MIACRSGGTLVVDEDRLQHVVRGLHDIFFQKLDPLIFE